MRSNRKSPTFFQSRGAAIAFFVLCLALLVLGCYVGVGMLTRYDYDPLIPEDAELRVTLAEEPYVKPTPVVTPVPLVTPTPLPTPMPTPAPTALALDLYSLQNTRIVMPKDANAPGEAALTSFYVSAADERRALLVTGYAFLDGCDAELSKIYLVVSNKGGSIHRFYQVSVLPGSTGVQHGLTRGQNLERADFRAAFSVRAYEDGPYNLGILVVNQQTKKVSVKGFFDLNDQYNFTVKSNAITEIA